MVKPWVRTVGEDDFGVGEARGAVEGVGPLNVGQRLGLVERIDVENVPALLQIPETWNATHVVEPTKGEESIVVGRRRRRHEPVEGDGLAEGLVGGAARLVEAELDAGLVGPRAACTARPVVALSLDSFFGNKKQITERGAGARTGGVVVFGEGAHVLELVDVVGVLGLGAIHACVAMQRVSPRSHPRVRV